jgi:IS30 family transposase
MEKYINDKLIVELWSPQQIVGHAKANNMPMVSLERIYQMIRKDKANGGDLWKHTRHKLKHRKRRKRSYLDHHRTADRIHANGKITRRKTGWPAG